MDAAPRLRERVMRAAEIVCMPRSRSFTEPSHIAGRLMEAKLAGGCSTNHGFCSTNDIGLPGPCRGGDSAMMAGRTVVAWSITRTFSSRCAGTRWGVGMPTWHACLDYSSVVE